MDTIQMARLNWHTYHDEENPYEDMIAIEGYERVRDGYYDIHRGEYVEPTHQIKTFYVPKETLLDIVKELIRENSVQELMQDISRRPY